MSDHPRTDFLLRTEFEDRLDRFKLAMMNEIKLANDHQDTEFNLGFRAMRADYAAGIEAIRQDLRSFVTNDVFAARMTPVQAVAYGLVALLMSLMSGMVAMALWKGSQP